MENDSIMGQIVLQLILIFTNAFFAASEMALVSLNEGRLRCRAEQGDKRAQTLLSMLREPSRFLSTIQVAITLAGFLGSAFAAEYFSGKLVAWLVGAEIITTIPVATLNTLSVIVITILFSYVTLVLGELVPKRIAMKKPEAVARVTLGVVRGFSIVLKPVVFLLTASTNGILRLLKIDPKNTEQTVSEDEIRMMVDMGNETGAIEENERELIENVFEFNDLTAEDVMIHRTEVEAIDKNATDAEIIAAIRETGLSRFPVYDGDIDDVIGVLRAREYLLARDGGGHAALPALITPAYFVPETARADKLLREMQANKKHMAIVVDEYGGTSGIVTMEDLLEELVGSIYDESDPTEPVDIEKLPGGEWRIAGTAELCDVAVALGLPEDAFDEYEQDTLTGLVFSTLTEIPPDGSRVETEIAGLSISAVEIGEHRVKSAIVRKIESEADEFCAAAQKLA